MLLVSPRGEVTAKSRPVEPAPQKRTLELSLQMSALCQKRTHALQHKTWLFDHLVGGGDQCWWDRQSERLSSFAVNDQLKSCRRLHWKIGRFFSFEDRVDVVCCWPEVTSDVNAIGGKGACHRVCTVGHGSSLIGSEAANNAPTKERGGRRRVS